MNPSMLSETMRRDVGLRREQGSSTRPELRVLVVDDFKEWRCFVASKLRKECQIEILEEASDGIEALDKAKKLRPELILLDIGLPRLNGLEVARRILQAAPKTRIIFLSENRSCEIAEEALRIGAAAYIVKTDAATALVPAMEAALSALAVCGKPS